MPTVNFIKETCLYSADLQRSRSFYEGKLGLECFTFDVEKFAFFRVGTSVLLIFNPDYTQTQTTLPPHFGTGHLHFAMEVPKDEFDLWMNRLNELSIPIEMEYTWPNGCRSVYFRDPDGHCVEFIEPGLWD